MNLASRFLERRRRKAVQARLDDIRRHAAELGITTDKVLQEYARIAFANLRHVVDWDDGKMKFKPSEKISEDDVAAIAEIVESAKDNKPYRVKLYDKRAALDAIARYLGMNLTPEPADDEPTANREDPREALIRELDRLAAKAAEGSGGQESEPGHG